jgi:enamine deaminase RidA (YjgF/YER057c/UK114 family)
MTNKNYKTAEAAVGTRSLISSNTAWEPKVGYSRAVRVGPFISVSGTTAFGPDGAIVGGGDPYVQTKQAIANVGAALERAGASLAHVVRTRLFVTDISRWQEYGRAHGEVFGSIRPASSMLGVQGLVDPAMLVEVEADAIIDMPVGA